MRIGKVPLSVLLIIAFNLYFIWYYRQHHEAFKTLLLLYWLQSVVIGLFTVVEMLSASDEEVVDVRVNNGPPLPKASARGCGALFFMGHYGTFHMVYLFMITLAYEGRIDMGFLKLSAGVVLAAEFMDFFRRRQAKLQTSRTINAGAIMFLPYLRIVPMHLMLVGASFSGWSDVTFFLVLKTVADLAMHWLTNRMYFRRPADQAS